MRFNPFRAVEYFAVGRFIAEPSPIFRQPFDKPSGRTFEALYAAAGMVFEVHPNIFLDGRGAAAIGDMVLLTEAGPQRLTRFPRDILSL